MPAQIAGSGGAQISRFLPQHRAVIIGRHRAAEGDNQVNIGQIGRIKGGKPRRTGVELQGGCGQAGRPQHAGKVGAKRLGGVVLDD